MTSIAFGIIAFACLVGVVESVRFGKEMQAGLFLAGLLLSALISGSMPI